MCRAAWLRMDVLIVVAIVGFVVGCTSPREYIQNGFKVGPNVGVPSGSTSTSWIDAEDQRVRDDEPDMAQWWTVFQDPTLDRLIADASAQNLSLREAGFRVLEARAMLGFAKGNLFPQSQSAGGYYQRGAASLETNGSPGLDQQFFDQWAFGFNLSWELDFWGRFRRAITAAENTLEASCNQYDHVLVTLLGDVAANYVQVRTLQRRIEYVRVNVDLQKNILAIAEKRRIAGAKGALDCHQARSNLAQTEAQIPQLRLAIRQACDRLSVLLGTPPTALEQELGAGSIPTAPRMVVVGIPAELLGRRPDVQRALHLAVAQGEQIGIAEAALYPMFAINGTLGYQAENLPQLLTSPALTGNIGPVFQWNILNYGRIRNNMRAQEAKFQSLVAAYQETVLRANAEVEDGLAAFLRAQERATLLDDSVTNSQQAVALVSKEYQSGAADFNRVALIEQNLVQQQDLDAQTHGDIALGLIQVYRALGGGWQYNAPGADTVAAPPASPESTPATPTEAPQAPSEPVSDVAPMPPELHGDRQVGDVRPGQVAPMPPQLRGNGHVRVVKPSQVAPMPPELQSTSS